jgi:hypothetical protein
VVLSQAVRGFGSDDDYGSFQSEAPRRVPQQKWFGFVYVVSVTFGSYEKDGLGNPGRVNDGLVQ